jgi:hypothetical protein
MENEESLEPEWDLFARLEKTEEAYKQLQKRTNKLRKEVKDIEPTLINLHSFVNRISDISNDTTTLIKNTNMVAMDGYALAFLALVGWNPSNARKMKDLVLNGLKRGGLKANILNKLERNLVQICEEAEKKRR